jgi:cytoskeletal protein CcmA (bactofilin family)
MFRSRKAAAAAQETAFRPLSYEDVRPLPVAEPPDAFEIPSPEMQHRASFIDPDTAEPTRGNRSDRVARPDVMTQMEMARRYAVEPASLPGERRPAKPFAGSPAALEAQDATRLCIGNAIRMKADIKACGAIQVDGYLEATAHCKELKVTKTGTLIGDLTVENADISGQFEGSLTVTDTLTVRTTGSISGTIKYNSVAIESGGNISGAIQRLETAAAPENGAPSNDQPTGPAGQFVGPERPEPATANAPPQLNLSEFRRERTDAATPPRPGKGASSPDGDRPEDFRGPVQPELSF